MALVQLADVIVPAVYETYAAENSPELTAFFQSGVAVRNDLIDSLADGGQEVNIPFWKDMDASTEPNYSTDQLGDIAVPDKITAGNMKARNAFMNKGMSAADLVQELAGSDPMRRIADRFGSFWQRQFQRRVIAALVGVLAGNVANNASDMVNDVSIADGLNAIDANLFTRGGFTGAVFTLGDHFGDLSAIAVHSVIMKRMIDNDDIEFIADSKGSLTIPTYMGKIVIVDDGLPVVAGGVSGFKYTSILFGSAAVGYGEGNPRHPVEVWRNPQGGNGAGIEQLWERKTWLIHIFGFSFISGAVAGQSATQAELKNAANWTRLLQRKNIPVAYLVTNG